MSSQRISSIEAFRVLACFGVVIIHSNILVASEEALIRHLGAALMFFAVLAVPFFLMVSGYFFGRKLLSGSADGQYLRKYLTRLGLPFLFWSAIYCLEFNPQEILGQGLLKAQYWHILSKVQWIFANPGTFLLEGTKVHLWFLVALAVWFTFLFALQKRLSIPFLLVIAAGVYLISIGLPLYAGDILPYDIPMAQRRIGGALLYIALGIHLVQRRRPISPNAFVSIAILHACEWTFVYSTFKNLDGGPLISHHVLTTPLFMYALVSRLLSWGTMFRQPLIQAVASYSFGIYLVHFVFINILKPYKNSLGVPSQLLLPILVFLLSLGAAVLMKRSKVLRHFT